MLKIKNLVENAKNTEEVKIIKKFYKLVQKTNENPSEENSSGKRDRDAKRKISDSSSVSSELNQPLKNEQSLKQSPKKARVEQSSNNLGVKQEPMVVDVEEASVPIMDEQAQKDNETKSIIKRLLKNDPQIEMNFELVLRLNEFIMRNSSRIEKRIIVKIHDKVRMYL